MNPAVGLLPFGPLLLIGLGGLELNGDDAGTAGKPKACADQARIAGDGADAPTVIRPRCQL